MADLSSTRLTATGTVKGARTRVRAIYNGGVAGSLELKDGGATGTSKLVLTMLAGQGFEFPADGILFDTDCHATLTTTADVTFLFE